jgi:hypothetical protein
MLHWNIIYPEMTIPRTAALVPGNLAIRPIHHQDEECIEAHIFVAFMAYCLHVTMKQPLRQCAPVSPRVVLEKLAAMKLLDVQFPTTDGRELLFTRYTQPEPDQQRLLAQLGWACPSRPTSHRRKIRGPG